MQILEEKFGVGVVCGADAVPERLVPYFGKKGNTITVVSGLNPWTDDSPDGNGYDVKGSDNLRTNNLYELFDRVKSKNYDVAHAHTRSKNLLKLNKQLKERDNTPFVYTVHGRDALFDPISMEFMKEADLVTAPSYSTIQEIRGMGISAKKTLAVYNSTDFTDYKNEFYTNIRCKDFKERLNGDGGKIVLCIGRLQEDKGIFETAKAVRTLVENGENIKLVHAGPCFDSKEKERLEGMFNNHKNSLSILGFVDDKDLPALYKSADMLVLPSDMKNETFGLVALEALAMETPVITSNQGGPKEVFVDSGMAIGIEPRDIESIQYAIKYVTDNYPAEKKRAENASNIVEKYYHTDVISDLWLKIYRKLGNKNGN